MKKETNAAVTAFKLDVDRMAEYLKAAGYDIKHTHLVEAGARFKGARDWRTLRAELENKEPQSKLSVPDMKGKTVRLYFSVHSCGDDISPDFCFADIDQRALQRMLELQQLCNQNELSQTDDTDFPFQWVDTYDCRIVGDCITVGWREFWFGGTAKYGSRFETQMFLIDGVVKDILEAVKSGKTELFYLHDGYSDEEQLIETLRDQMQELKDKEPSF